jgi:prevent-host-death family protein
MCSLAMPPANDSDGSLTLDRNRKGNIAEAAVVFHAARLGIQVFRPLSEHGRYDLVLDVGGSLHRVQCKWAQRIGDVVSVKLVGNRLTPAGYVRTKYQSGEIDAVAAYCGDLDRCYYLPSGLVTDRNAISLRLAATKNGQTAGLHWAADYELSVVAAHLNGAPLRSATAIDVRASTIARPNDPLVVTAHNFRDRFGHYMELAAKGDRVTVTRHGRPFVQLESAVLTDSG